MSRDLLRNTILALLMEAPGLGEIQLRKAILIIDVLNQSFYGKGLTGTVYIKYPHGPVPDEDSWQVLLSMLREGSIYRKEEPVGTWTKHAHYPKADPDYKSFTEDQIAFIQDAARFAKKNTAKNLSQITHDDVYNKTPMGKAIPLSSMFTIRIKPPRKLEWHQKDEIRSALEADEDFTFKPSRRQKAGAS